MSERFTGWGLTTPSVGRSISATASGLPEALADTGPRGLIARGLGRSYGDAAQNGGGMVLRPLPEDIEMLGDGLVRASAGTSLHSLIRTLLVHGLFVPVTPGTRYITVGGAIAFDVHGKNHHRAGSFGDHVQSLSLVLADGTSEELRPDDPDPAVRSRLWATVGGMGLTGVITSAVLRCLPVESGHLRVDTRRTVDLDATMVLLQEADASHTYTVAWVDMTARGRSLGRSVFTFGEHAAADDLPPRLRRSSPLLPGDPRLTVPFVLPGRAVNRLSARAFNEAWFHRAPRRREGELQSIAGFFHPLDGVGHWNRIYGRRGFVQYQFVVPDSSAYVVGEALEAIVGARAPSFLSVLKRFGPGNPALMSFPEAGWSLAVDFPVEAGLGTLLARLDRMVLAGGGRLYLAKDARMDPSLLAPMYPRLDEFRELRAQMDPDRTFQSDMARRLRL